MSLTLGFIGCGLIARAHAKKLQTVVAAGNASIGPVYDIDPERTRAFATDHGGSEAGSADDVISAADAVYVTTWTAVHPELVSKVAAAGKPVFCEKPLAVDLATTRQMVTDVERSGVINQVGLILRNSPSFRWLRHHVRSGEFGKPMSMVFRDDQYIPTQGMYGSTWRGDVALAGSGALLEHSIHDLDLIEWILGPIERVTCLTAHHHGIDGIEDQATVTLKSEAGAIATLSSTWHDVLTRPSQRLVEVFCEGAYFALDGDWHGPMRLQTSTSDSVIELGNEAVEAAAELDGLGTNPDADFVASIRAGGPAYPTFRTALRAHELVDAAYRSAAAGGPAIDSSA